MEPKVIKWESIEGIVQPTVDERPISLTGLDFKVELIQVTGTSEDPRRNAIKKAIRLAEQHGFNLVDVGKEPAKINEGYMSTPTDIYIVTFYARRQTD